MKSQTNMNNCCIIKVQYKQLFEVVKCVNHAPFGSKEMQEMILLPSNNSKGYLLIALIFLHKSLVIHKNRNNLPKTRKQSIIYEYKKGKNMENILEETRFIMKKYGIKANKSLGQNFLIDAITYSISRCFPQVISSESIPDFLLRRPSPKDRHIH